MADEMLPVIRRMSEDDSVAMSFSGDMVGEDTEFVVSQHKYYWLGDDIVIAIGEVNYRNTWDDELFDEACARLEAALSPAPCLSTDTEVLRGQIGRLVDLIDVQAKCLEGYAEQMGYSGKAPASVFHWQATHFRDIGTEIRKALSSTIDSADDHVAGDGKKVGGDSADHIAAAGKLIGDDSADVERIDTSTEPVDESRSDVHIPGGQS